MLNLLELLGPRGVDHTVNARLVRHRDTRFDVTELRRRGYLDTYQSYQSRPRFDGCRILVSFVGLEQSRALFIGVYRVLDRVSASQAPPPPPGYPLELTAPGGFFYEMERLPGYDDLTDRVVIDWGRNARTWVQALQPKEVIEILPSGYVREFPGFLEFVLTYDELAGIIAKPEANREWHRMLGATAGIYLITDTRTGAQYVGSASGVGGVLGRWGDYVQTGHGGNVRLREIIGGETSRRHELQFTLLQTLPRELPKREVIAREELYKRKLGSRVFGLNS